MDKQFAKHMRWGKYVKNSITNEIYKLIENMDAEKDTVKVVKLDNWERYHLLGAWIQNHYSNSMGFRDRFTGNIEDCVIERQSYEEEQNISDVIPQNRIPFITPNYKNLFTVTELDFVEFDTYGWINGKYVKIKTEHRRVIADDCGDGSFDACHFHFEGGNCYHICEFAEKVNLNGDIVRPLNGVHRL